MNGSKIRVLALDLDGTLTNDEKIVTPRTRAALDAAAAQGVTIVLASGRPTAGITPLAKELGLDKKGGCLLSYNGGKIIDCRTGEKSAMELSGSNVLRYELADGTTILVRPSGTEPKIKVYVLTIGETPAARDENLRKYGEWVKTLQL